MDTRTYPGDSKSQEDYVLYLLIVTETCRLDKVMTRRCLML